MPRDCSSSLLYKRSWTSNRNTLQNIWCKLHALLYSLVIKTIKIELKNAEFFKSTVPMWFMSVASEGMQDSFSAASKLVCTIILLLKNFTDYHNIYLLWTLNAGIKSFKRVNWSLHPQDWWSFWMEEIWTGNAVLAHVCCFLPIIHAPVQVLPEHSLKKECQLLS